MIKFCPYCGFETDSPIVFVQHLIVCKPDKALYYCTDIFVHVGIVKNEIHVNRCKGCPKLVYHDRESWIPYCNQLDTNLDLREPSPCKEIKP